MADMSFNLRVAMAARNMSQSQLAQRVDVSRAFMNNLVLGKKMPSSGRLLEIARVLDVSVDFLMGGDDVHGQIDDVLQNRPVRMTARQAYLAQEAAE